MTYRRRIARLEHQQLLAMATEAGRPYGLSGEAVLAEAQQFLALAPAAQAAELDALMAPDDPDTAHVLEILGLQEGRR